MPGRVVIHQDGADAHRFNLLDDDGTVLASSKAFASADAARAGLRRAIDVLSDPELIDQEGDGRPTGASAEVVDHDQS